jgi:1,4-alpha-glucan branching enzyme
VSFRVWAPHATAALVEGDFGASVPLVAGDGGVFGAVVPGAQAGQRYRFALTSGAQMLPRLDPRARASDGDWSVIVDPAAYAWKSGSFTPPARPEAVVYELHIGSFAASGAGTGTFLSAIDRLDSLADLGVNVIELMPTNQFGGSAGGWGYNPQGYFAPRPDYGSPDDLRRLVDEAHARGIAVLLDLVYNHYDGWSKAPLRCFDGDCPGNSPGVYFFGAGAYQTTPWGPRPDYTNPQVASFLLDGVTLWLQDYRVDGFRWDSTSNIRGVDGKGEVPGGRDLLRQANERAAAIRPGVIRIAEDLKGESLLTAPLSASGGLGFDAQWDGLGYPLIAAIVGSDDKARDLGAVRAAMGTSYNGDPFARVLFSENHDLVGNGSARLPSRIDGADPGSWAARKRSMLAAAVVLTTPGVPMLFMGQEMLARGPFANPPDPLDWSLADAYAPVRSFYRDMIRLRRNLEGHSAGLLGSHLDIYHVNDGAKVFAYRRWQESGDDVIILVNFSGKPYTEYDLGLPAAGPWQIRLDSDHQGYSTDFAGGNATTTVATTGKPRDGLPFTGGVALGAYSLVVLSR